MAGIYSQGGSAGHRYAGWLETVEAKNFQFGGKVFNGSPSAIYVGSNLVWANWLKAATKQAILGAFGQTDGMAVIKATNAYLNQLAASDRDKATALAALINEDPMMVCSLGLQPDLTVLPVMPERALKGDGTAYINIGIIFAEDGECEIKFRLGTFSNYPMLFGSRYGGSNELTLNQANASALDAYIRQGLKTFSGLSANADNVVKVTWQKVTLNSSEWSTGKAKTDSDHVFTIGGVVTGRYSQWRGRIYYANYKEGDDIVRQFLPFRLGKAWSADKVSTGVAQAKDTLGMIDLVTGIFYPNAASSGAFTMEGEPTPSTP